MEFKDVAIKAAKETGKIIRDNFGKANEISTKGGNYRDLVTDVDMKANKLIVGILQESFPDHGIISEEINPIKGNEYIWYIDPLDGTTNFTMGIPFLSVSIGLTCKGKPILGIIFNPMIDELFVGEENKGATLNGKRIMVSGNSDLKKTIVTYCHKDNEIGISSVTELYNVFKTTARDFRKLGSSNLEICYVSCGRLDVYLNPSDISLYDVLPGYVIAKEAGAKITDWNGDPWSFNSKNILVSNGTSIHQDVLRIIKRGK